jgi:hypothetical protein
MTEKLWEECSVAEHRAVKRWNKVRKRVFAKYRNKEISHDTFITAVCLLEIYLDMIEKQFR